MTMSTDCRTVGQWVVQCPATSRVFEDFGIDFCCGGDETLAEACRTKKIDLQAVLQRLRDVQDRPDQPDETDWSSESMSDLCDHIETMHHAFLRSELPRLEQLGRRVIQRHGEAHPELLDVMRKFQELRAELEPHMAKEELVLFPAIRQLESASRVPDYPFGTIANPIEMMEHEHDTAGGVLKEIRRLTNQFQPPPGACNSYRAWYDSLRELEVDMHLHIHKENNVLFPRALQLQTELGAA